MKNKLLKGLLLVSMILSAATSAMAESRFEMPNIGAMKAPEHVTFEKGEQSALLFLNDRGIKSYFMRKGAIDGDYYTMTYSNPPDFSYGWATVQKLGVPYLLDIGEIAHKNDPIESQLDIIAADLNKKIVASRAVYTGSTPLHRVDDKTHPRWEGSFSVIMREKGIVYHEAYQVVLQSDGYLIFLGIINSDSEQKELTAELQKMLLQRKMPTKKSFLNLSKRHASIADHSSRDEE